MTKLSRLARRRCRVTAWHAAKLRGAADAFRAGAVKQNYATMKEPDDAAEDHRPQSVALEFSNATRLDLGSACALISGSDAIMDSTVRCSS
jgi:hypothetical protein